MVLRHACGALAMGLRQVTNRRMANAMYEPGIQLVLSPDVTSLDFLLLEPRRLRLWLHAEGQRLAVAAEAYSKQVS